MVAMSCMLHDGDGGWARILSLILFRIFQPFQIKQSRLETYFCIQTELEHADLILIERTIDHPVYLAGMGVIVEKIRMVERYFRRMFR